MIGSTVRFVSDMWWYTPSRYRIMEHMSDALYAFTQTTRLAIKYAQRRKDGVFHHVLVLGDVDDDRCVELMEKVVIALVHLVGAREHTIGAQPPAWDAYSNHRNSPPLTIWKLNSDIAVTKHIMPHLLPYGKLTDGPTNIVVLCCVRDESSAARWASDLRFWDVPKDNIMTCVASDSSLSEHGVINIVRGFYVILVKASVIHIA